MRMVRRQSGAEDAECMRSKRDNRVRVCDQITCSPVWAALIPPFLQSDTGEPPNRWTRRVRASNTVHYGGPNNSRIELPAVPAPR
jgi:hypothetical protein